MTPDIFMFIGFALAAYSIVANDSIQTLGTFLASNSHRPWWVLWIFGSGILTAVLLFGWIFGGDVAYGRLDTVPMPEDFDWYYIVPPIVLLLLTRFGYPVSTTFLILTFFKPSNLDSMLIKSIFGYLVAFAAAFVLYSFVLKKLERHFHATHDDGQETDWVVFQWLSTGFLWSQWLIQDLANIYVYMPREVSLWVLLVTLAIMVGLQGIIFYTHGGEIQKIVTSKSNTTDIRSATFVDLLFGVVLLIFKEISNIPMSTTWVFLGLLAGREISLRLAFRDKEAGESIVPTCKLIASDLAKATFGIIVSVALALALPHVRHLVASLAG